MISSDWHIIMFMSFQNNIKQKFKTMLHYMVLQKHMFNLYNFILGISSNLYLSIMYS